MSCGGGGCSSCGTESGVRDLADEALPPTPSPQPPGPALDSRPLLSRIQHVAAKLRVQLEAEQGTGDAVDESQAAEFSLLFNDIAITLAGGNAQAVKPLLALFDECGPSSFLDACQLLIALDCAGLLLAWAFEYAAEDPHVLLRLLQQQAQQQSDTEECKRAVGDEAELSLSALVAYVNRQAAFHECFPGNERVGRMHLPVPSEGPARGSSHV